MAVADNDIVNTNTYGFKKSRAVLEEGQNGAVKVSIQEIDTTALYLAKKTLLSKPKTLQT